MDKELRHQRNVENGRKGGKTITAKTKLRGFGSNPQLAKMVARGRHLRRKDESHSSEEPIYKTN